MKYSLSLCVMLLCSTLFAQMPSLEDQLKVLEKDPNNFLALYNAGLFSYLDGKYKDSLKYWLKLKKIEAYDWKLRAKIIQAYSALNEVEKRDKEIAELRALRASGKYPDLSKAKFFIRDQFNANDLKIFVFEYYDLKGDRPLIWKFYLNKNGKLIDYYISFGSYDFTTEVMRANKSIGPNERAYHLDGYWKNGDHATYGIYTKKPSYDFIKDKVIKIINKKAKPISSMTVKENEKDSKTGKKSSRTKINIY